MTPGSVQLRKYRIARRDGMPTAEAERHAGLLPGEGALVDAEDALNPPGPECFVLPGFEGLLQRARTFVAVQLSFFDLLERA